MTDIKATFICEQCVKEGAIPPKIGDTDMDCWGIEQEIEEVIFIKDNMVLRLKCGHEYWRYHHIYGVAVEYKGKWK